MYPVYTRRARRILQQAATIAGNAARDYVAPVDLLLAATRIESSIAQTILREFHIFEQDVTAHINGLPRNMHPVYSQPQTPVNLPLNQVAHRAIANAGQLAQQQGLTYIGTEHLLQGVLMTKDAAILRVLANSHVLLKDMLNRLADFTSKPATPLAKTNTRQRDMLKPLTVQQKAKPSPRRTRQILPDKGREMPLHQRLLQQFSRLFNQ